MREILGNFTQFLIDFIFPPNPEELRLRALSAEQFLIQAKQAASRELPFIYSIFSYKDPLVKELVWQIKYKKNMDSIKKAAFALHNFLSIKNSEPTLLIPIPISKKRRKERGYNQCELIIDEIIKLDNKNQFQKNFNLLIRSKHFDSLTKKNKNERVEQTRNLYETTRDIVTQQQVILIDDVTTTGSTIKEAREALLKSGYTNVVGLTIAH